MKVIKVKKGGGGRRRKEGRQRRGRQNNWKTNKDNHAQTELARF